MAGIAVFAEEIARAIEKAVPVKGWVLQSWGWKYLMPIFI